jgi:ATP-dependent Clp protease ATP-binding subunit ClpA
VEGEVFEDFSERSLRVVFLARMSAGRRGCVSLEAVDLLDAVVREDQGEMAARFPGAVTSSGPVQPPERPFFSRETASQILSAIEDVLPPKAAPLLDSADIGCSPALGEIFAHATAHAKELHHDKVQPLHLLVAMLPDGSSGVGEILKRVGISKEAVIAASQS